jgi:arylsulfatase
VYFPGTLEVPEAVAVNVRGRSFKISAEVAIDRPDAEGVLFAHGHAFGGHALYVKDGKVKYVYDYLGVAEQVVESELNVPTGACVLGVEFTKESQTPQATVGSLALYMDDKKVGELDNVKTQNGKFALCGEGLNIGRDGASPVTWDYPGQRPWSFTGGTIKQVIVDVSGEPYLDLEKEAMAVLSRE